MAVADPVVRARLALLVRECGAITRDVTLDRYHPGCCIALIHDLSPWTEAGIEKFRAYHYQAPQLPFLLYVPPGSAGASLIGACAALRGVRLEVHKPPIEERPVLRRHIAWLLDAAPGQQVLRILRILFPDAPPRVSRFFRRALEQVAHGPVAPWASVKASAEALGISPRSLERDVRRPKRMLLWISLLYLMLVARLSGQSPGDAAEALGVTRKRFQELCQTLLPEDREMNVMARKDLHWVLAALAQEYGLPSAITDQAVAALAS